MIATSTATAICITCHTRPAAHESWMCAGCFARMRSSLATLTDAYDQLAEGMATMPPGWRTGAIHGTEESRLPFDPDLHDLRVRITTAIHTWCIRVTTEHPGRLVGPPHAGLDATVPWLRIQLPWCSGQSWVTDLAGELDRLRREAGTHIRLNPAHRPLPTPCGGCGRLSLAEFPGDDAVICRNRECGGLYEWPAYADLVQRWCDRVTMEARRRRSLPRSPTEQDRRLAAALDPDDDTDPAGIWLDSDEAADAAHVAAGTVRSWASRGEITAYYRDGDDTPLYRLAEILAREAATRTGRRELTLLGEAFAHIREREQDKQLPA